jgi:hypothetical protein
MLFGILRMPYNMAMANEISRHQYWQSGQQAAQEIERLREALRKAGAAVERLAFKMPPPNVWTPQFVQLGQQIARSALQQKESE